MYVSIHGIVLNTIRYSDRQNIVRVLTEEMGLLSCAVAQGGGKGARRLASVLMPLSLVEAEARILPGRDLATLRDVVRSHPLAAIYADPVKSAVAIYITELLVHTITGQQRDTALFRFVREGVITLEGLGSGVANFHLYFTFGLGALLGIRPDIDGYRQGDWFDMEGGTFGRNPSLRGSWLPPERARVIVLLARMRPDNLHLFRFSRGERGEVLDTMLAYFRLHNSSLGSLRSPEVLKQLFD